MVRKILVVEDNLNNRILVRDFLKYHGYEIVEAEDGDEGVSKARNERPDLVLMDIQMKKLNGIAAIRMLKDDPATRGIKIVAVTSFAMSGDRERIMAAGADEYVAKPIDMKSLHKIVEGLLA